MKRAFTHLLAVAMLLAANFANAADMSKIGGFQQSITVCNTTDDAIIVKRKAPDGSDAPEWIEPGETKKVEFIPGATFQGIEVRGGLKLQIRLYDGGKYVVTKKTTWRLFGGHTTEYDVSVTYSNEPTKANHELEKPLGITLKPTDDGRQKVTGIAWGELGHRMGLKVDDIIDGYKSANTHPYHATMLITLNYTDGFNNNRVIEVQEQYGSVLLAG